MNLPSYTRAALATGVFSLAFALSGYALTPPFLFIHKTTYNIGQVVSGSAAHLNNHLYYAGGTLSGGSVTNALTDVDTFHHTVTARAPMPTARTGLGLAAAFNGLAPGNNILYAIGGTTGTGALGSNEVYDVANGTWSVLAPMPTPRAYLTVVAGTDGNIYAIGGVDSTGKTVSTVEVYNPSKNSWTTGLSLNTARSHHAAILGYLDFIIVAGGQDATGKVLNTTEFFSLQNPTTWVPGASMNTPRADFGISLGADGFVHAFGGRSTTGNVRSIEAFKFSTNSWINEPEQLPTPVSGIAVTEGISGAIFTLGGKNGATFQKDAVLAFPPWEPAHSTTFFVHGYDEPYVNGNFAMDSIPPLQGFGILNLGLLSTTKFTTYPDVGGVIGSGGTMTINVPATIILGLINGLSVTAENQDGSNPVVIGSVSSLLGLSGNVPIPITTPLTLQNKLLVLTVSSILGVDLNLGGGYLTVTLTNYSGKPSNPQ